MNKIVIYNHGKDSTPWGEKTLAFADVAKRHGYAFASPDYRNQPDPDKRVSQLQAMDVAAYQTIVLIGSSMGAYVAAAACESLKASGLFLLAPAFYLPGYRRNEFNLTADKIEVFHGWRDTIVPPEHSWRFCQTHRLRLNLYDTDHRMMSVLPQLVDEFSRFLSGLSL